MIFFVFLALLFQVFLSGCSLSASTSRSFHTDAVIDNATQIYPSPSSLSLLSQVTLKDQQHVFQVEVARTEPELEKGLMYRTSLPQNHGMLFVFPDERARAFWMKNTLIPLDMIFADSDRKIVKIWRDVPPCKLLDNRSESRFNQCPTYSSETPSRYVVEVNAGTAQGISLQEGDQVFLPKEIL